jgi:Cu(I)/Ag(I) efflux system protein CusF
MYPWRLVICAAVVAAAPLMAAQAQIQAPVSASNVGSWAEGEVRRIDRENKKITLRHGEIKSLDMPPMTMVFQVKNPSLLDKAAVGAKVLFQAVQESGSYILTDLKPAQP